jgi:hypothetical protein
MNKILLYVVLCAVTGMFGGIGGVLMAAVVNMIFSYEPLIIVTYTAAAIGILLGVLTGIDMISSVDKKES